MTTPTDTTAVPEFCADCGETFRPGDKRLIIGNRKYHSDTCGPAPTDRRAEGEAVVTDDELDRFLALLDLRHCSQNTRDRIAKALNDAVGYRYATLSAQLAEAQGERDAWHQAYDKSLVALKEVLETKLIALKQLSDAMAQLAEAQGKIERLRALLHRYRHETPLGHQPHMIAHEVDVALSPSSILCGRCGTIYRLGERHACMAHAAAMGTASGCPKCPDYFGRCPYCGSQRPRPPQQPD